jgi:L-lactate dehydrogenase complex protein LldG
VKSDERAAVRQRLSAAVARALLPGAPVEHPGRLRPSAANQGPQLDRFRAQLTALGGVVHDTPTVQAAADLIASLAIAEAARPRPAGDAEASAAGTPQLPPAVLMWHPDQLPWPGLADEILARGLRVFTQSDLEASSQSRRAELAGALVGVTGADAALAETGSIVLASGPGRGRLASLLPPVHVALLDRGALVESLSDLMADRPDLITAGSNVVCITGPSRTADIEHTLSRGVHGPREVHVALVAT